MYQWHNIPRNGVRWTNHLPLSQVSSSDTNRGSHSRKHSLFIIPASERKMVAYIHKDNSDTMLCINKFFLPCRDTSRTRCWEAMWMARFLEMFVNRKTTSNKAIISSWRSDTYKLYKLLWVLSHWVMKWDDTNVLTVGTLESEWSKQLVALALWQFI